jgi:hypothetical protein
MTIRQYKKDFWIGRDSFGKMIYMNDTVEVWIPYETHTPHQSKVLWDRMDGAFIEAHPAHIKMHEGVHHRDLRSYLNQDPMPVWGYETENEDEEGTIMGYKQGYVKKVKSFYTE